MTPQLTSTVLSATLFAISFLVIGCNGEDPDMPTEAEQAKLVAAVDIVVDHLQTAANEHEGNLESLKPLDIPLFRAAVKPATSKSSIFCG